MKTFASDTPGSEDRTGGGAVGTGQVATSTSMSTRRPALGAATRLLNPIILKLAGKRYVRVYAVVEHRGRRSGRTYRTPVAARRTAEGFMVPMAFGAMCWRRGNVSSAGMASPIMSSSLSS